MEEKHDVEKEGFQITDIANGGHVVLALIPGGCEISLNVLGKKKHISLTLEEWEAVSRCLSTMDWVLKSENNAKAREALRG